MKVLSIWEPWAWLIVNGFKDVENRGWTTKHRGPLLIHAAKKFDWNALYRLDEDAFVGVIRHFNIPVSRRGWQRWIDRNKLGGIVGIVDLHHIGLSDSCWAEPGQQHWQLKDAMVLPFARINGKQGLWNYNLTTDAGNEFSERVNDWLWAYATRSTFRTGLTVDEIVTALNTMMSPGVVTKKEIQDALSAITREYTLPPIKQAAEELGIVLNR